MTPSPDIIRDFSRLQAEVEIIGRSNIAFAQENARLRQALNNIRRKAVAEYGVRDVTRLLGEMAESVLSKKSDPLD